MSDGKLSITLKGHNDPPWVVFHPESIVEAKQLLADAQSGNLFQEVVEAALAYKATLTGQPAADPMPAAVAAVQAAMPATVVSSAEQPQAAGNGIPTFTKGSMTIRHIPGLGNCVHGPRVEGTGLAKATGKPYRMLLCAAASPGWQGAPVGRDAECPPAR